MIKIQKVFKYFIRFVKLFKRKLSYKNTTMPKRLCPFTENQQAVKKQEIYGNKGREIKSTLSEKALQLLYLGASKQVVNSKISKITSLAVGVCNSCQKVIESEIKCSYCEALICSDCAESCNRCVQEYCKKCVFIFEDKGYSICYSCY